MKKERTYRIEVKKEKGDPRSFSVDVYSKEHTKPIHKEIAVNFKELMPKVAKFLKRFPDSELIYESREKEVIIKEKKVA